MYIVPPLFTQMFLYIAFVFSVYIFQRSFQTSTQICFLFYFMTNDWNLMNCGWLSLVQCGLFVSLLDKWPKKLLWALSYLYCSNSQFSFFFLNFPRMLYDYIYSVEIMISDTSDIVLSSLQKPSPSFTSMTLGMSLSPLGLSFPTSWNKWEILGRGRIGE